jgi:hypothetical protein
MFKNRECRIEMPAEWVVDFGRRRECCFDECGSEFELSQNFEMLPATCNGDLLKLCKCTSCSLQVSL